MAIFRRDVHWQVEHGSDFDLRELRGGHPTGRVARLGWAGDVEQVRGRGVSLFAEGNRLTVVEQAEPGRSAARIQLPRRSIVDVVVVPEPGIPRVLVTLIVEFGPARFPIQLWFDAAARPALERVLRGLGWTPPHPDGPEAAKPVELPLLEVRSAPASEDWLVFRPGACSAEVLRAAEPVVPAQPPGGGAPG
jgi:hypothetical protein